MVCSADVLKLLRVLCRIHMGRVNRRSPVDCGWFSWSDRPDFNRRWASFPFDLCVGRVVRAPTKRGLRLERNMQNGSCHLLEAVEDDEMEVGGVSDWRSILNADPMEWLLEKDNPSVRYFTLTEILGKRENDVLVKETKEDIMKTGVVPAILVKQHKEGYWEKSERLYTAKYKGTVWQLLVLAELNADGSDGRIKKACEFVLENSQDHESGGFSYTSTGGGRHNGAGEHDLGFD